MHKKNSIITTVYLSSACASLGAGIEQGFHDPTAAARGNAYVATADNPSAVHYNPAGLAWQDGITAQSVTYVSRANIKHTGGSGDFKHNQAVPSGALFFNYSGLADKKLALGLGITIPHGLGIKYDEDYPLRTQGHDAYLAHLVISPAISYKLNDKFSLGMTLNYAHDDYEAESGIIVPRDSFHFKGSGKGWGYSLGALYRPSDQWSIGITYRSSIKTQINGTATTNAIAPIALNLSESASTHFNYPQQVVLGVAFKPNNKWLIETNVQWTDWTSFDEGLLVKPSGNITQILAYEDTIAFGVGVSNKLTERTRLNFGYFFSTPAAPAKTYSALVTNSEVSVFSVGIEHEINQWKLSGGILYQYNRRRSISNSPTNIAGVNADGKWSVSGTSAIIGAVYKF